jgi:hypothetical protein
MGELPLEFGLPGLVDDGVHVCLFPLWKTFA